MHGEAKSPSTRPNLLSKVRKGDEIAWSEFYSIYRKFISQLTPTWKVRVADHCSKWPSFSSSSAFLSRAWFVSSKAICQAKYCRWNFS
jgi:hypothetical protein